MKIEQLNVKQFLETGREEPFLVPDYQRPYSWGEEEIVTLFNDLLLFTEGDVSKKNKNSNDTYFLGTVISFKNENGEQEIIDGQQRITSLFLLLRAIYTKLKTFSKKTNLYDELLSEIEPILWKNVIKSEGAVKNVLISSSVINDEGNNILKGILENALSDWRKVVAKSIEVGIPMPCMASAITFLDGYTSARLPANLLQAQRDYFGAHTYERTDKPRGEFFHTNWTGRGGNTASTTYDV